MCNSTPRRMRMKLPQLAEMAEKRPLSAVIFVGAKAQTRLKVVFRTIF